MRWSTTSMWRSISGPAGRKGGTLLASLDAAAAFVTEHGGPLDRALLGRIRNGSPIPPQLAAALLAGQQPDGGWVPPWGTTTGISGVDCTCFKLAQAERAGLGASHPAMVRALSFLLQRQRSAGDWHEEEALAAAAPPWARSSEAAVLYLTANAGFWAAVLGGQFEGTPGAGGDRAASGGAAQAATYLAERLGEDGALPSFEHAHWLAAGLLWRTAQRPAAERILHYLASRLNDLNASNLAWLITALAVAGVPAVHPSVQAAAARLSGMQQKDGRWVSEDGPDWDVHATLEVIRALHLTAG